MMRSIYSKLQLAKLISSGYNFRVGRIMSAGSERTVFINDPAFCPDCGTILPLPSEEDKVSCKVCKAQLDTEGEHLAMTFVPGWIGQ